MKKAPFLNQHPPAHNEGWMIIDEETVFCWIPVPLANPGGLAQLLVFKLPTYKQPTSRLLVGR
jgi:hypothetical protein